MHTSVPLQTFPEAIAKLCIFLRQSLPRSHRLRLTCYRIFTEFYFKFAITRPNTHLPSCNLAVNPTNGNMILKSRLSRSQLPNTGKPRQLTRKCLSKGSRKEYHRDPDSTLPPASRNIPKRQRRELRRRRRFGKR